MATTYQYTQGSMVVVSLNTTDQLGNPVTPDGNQTPTIQVAYETPSGPVVVIQNLLMTAVTNSFYYAIIQSTLLSVGSYTATSTWIYQGQSLSFTSRFDILAFDGQVLLPLDPISRLRIRLKDNDIDPTRWIWSDQELSEYLNDALDNFNAMPPMNAPYFWFNVPMQYVDCILMYAEFLAIKAQGFKLASQGVSYSDRNITLNVPQQAQAYFTQASFLEKIASDKAKLLKRQFITAGFIVTPSLAFLTVPPLRAWGRGWSF